MTKTLIIPDIHGDSDLLSQMIATHSTAERIISIGDLANCVYSSARGDVECLSIARAFNIEMLVGNHEYPYFGGGRFAGFANVPEVKDAIRALDWKVATTVGDILLTHAGISFALMSFNPDVEKIATILNAEFAINPCADIFSACGPQRGGYAKSGGILWADYDEPKDQSIRQIFGHTQGDSVRVDGNSTCIDCKLPYIIDA